MPSQKQTKPNQNSISACQGQGSSLAALTALSAVASPHFSPPTRVNNFLH